MDFYSINFAGLLLINGGLAYREFGQGRNGYGVLEESEKQEEGMEGSLDFVNQKSVGHFKRMFFLVYGLVFGADWLQVSSPFKRAPLNFVV